jgi:hypothetical protein
MSKLRERMIRDMNLAGMTQRTQKEYIRAVRQLIDRYGISPVKISEEQVYQYLTDLHKNVARGTFQVKYSGIKFFFYQTLDVNWNLFTKKKSACPARSVCPAL